MHDICYKTIFLNKNTQSSYQWMNFGMQGLKVKQDDSPFVPMCDLEYS